MQKLDLTNYLETKQQQATKHKSERSELIEKFMKRLNADREEAGFKPLSPGFVSMKMAQAGLKTNDDLYWFYSYCDDARHFAKCWWWSMKAGVEVTN